MIPDCGAVKVIGSVKQITFASHGHLLTHCNVWSPDSKWIVYDVRSDAAGSLFDGTRIERVQIETLQVEVLFESKKDACCGVVTYSPMNEQVVFIHGPEHPTEDWRYGPFHRQGVIIATDRPGIATPLDARNLVEPFTEGAFRRRFACPRISSWCTVGQFHLRGPRSCESPIGRRN